MKVVWNASVDRDNSKAVPDLPFRTIRGPREKVRLGKRYCRNGLDEVDAPPRRVSASIDPKKQFFSVVLQSATIHPENGFSVVAGLQTAPPTRPASLPSYPTS